MVKEEQEHWNYIKTEKGKGGRKERDAERKN
jgi:hypothetical protein